MPLKKRRARALRARLRWRLWPAARVRKRAWHRFRRAPGLLQGAVALTLLAILALAVNGIYQVLRKPTELFFPVSGALNKLPDETWSRYGPLFEKHSTAVTTAPFLAALAQVEAARNVGRSGLGGLPANLIMTFRWNGGCHARRTAWRSRDQ